MASQETVSGQEMKRADESPGVAPQHGPEWQPWDTGSKLLVIAGVIVILGLMTVFAMLSLNH